MAQAVNVNFKLDPDTKKSFEEVCSEMGLSVSAALTVFVKKVSREKSFSSVSALSSHRRKSFSSAGLNCFASRQFPTASFISFMETPLSFALHSVVLLPKV